MARRNFIVLAGLALAALATTHAVSAEKPTRPKWRKKPDFDAFWAAMPALAVEKGVSGKATLSCEVDEYGLLQGCKTRSETPAGYGFGEAAKALAPLYQLRPALRDGHAVPGGTINVPFVWDLEGVKPGDIKVKGRTLLIAPPWAAAPSQAQVAAAWPRRAQSASEGFATLRCGMDAEGVPASCELLSQAPDGQGFGDMARGLAADFRLAFSEADRPTLKTLAVDIRFHFINPARADQRKLGAPRWVRTLSPTGMADLYPVAARQAGVLTGKVSVRCVAQADGALADCASVHEEPTDLGFGAAALGAAKAMRMNPWTEDGQPVDGLPLTLPIRFTWDEQAGGDKAAGH